MQSPEHRAVVGTVTQGKDSQCLWLLTLRWGSTFPAQLKAIICREADF